MSNLSARLQRLRNAFTKLRHGTRLFGENVTPDVPNDLFQAHASIYLWFSCHVSAARVLDIGCGTGYGAAAIRAAGARAVVGLDVDLSALSFARRRFGAPEITFQYGDAEAPPSELGHFQVIVSSNAFEHLTTVDKAIDGVVTHLTDDGLFLLAVPPIFDTASLDANLAIRYHHTNLFVDEWVRRLRARFREVRFFRHVPPPNVDLGSPFRSRLTPDQFYFVEVPAPLDLRGRTMTALFRCSGPIR